MADADPQPLPWLREAQIVDSGSRYAFTPYLDNPDKSLRDYLNDVGRFEQEIHVLNLLQHTRTTALDAPALQILLNALVDALPTAIQEKVRLHMCAVVTGDSGAVIGQPHWFQEEDEFFEQRAQYYKNSYPPLNPGNEEFVLWVVNAGTSDDKIRHYMTIVLRYGPLGRITDWAVADGLHAEGMPRPPDRVKARISRLLASHGIADATEHQLWVPPYADTEMFASGLAACSTVAQLLDRISVMHCAEGNFDADAFFVPTRPWVNVDALRAESLGRVAMKAMEKLKWKTRLGLYPIQPFADDAGGSVDSSELAPSGVPPVAHTISPPPDGSGDGDSLFAEPKSEDAASQSVDAPEPEEPETARPVDAHTAAIESVLDAQRENDKETLENYMILKYRDIDRVGLEVATAEDACREAAHFSERMLFEVLESPFNNIPSAYAVEKLFWLVRRAIERTRSAEQQNADLCKNWTNERIHIQANRDLDLSKRFTKFQEQIEQLKDIYKTADQHLNTVYAARAERGMGDLADVDKDVDDVAEASGEEKGGSVTIASDIDEDEDEDEDVAEPGSSIEQKDAENPKKRKYNFETTSTIDADGEPVYTMNVQRKARKPVKRSKKN